MKQSKLAPISSISQSEVRALSLRAQGFQGISSTSTVDEVLTNLGCLQVDSISVTGFRSHELVLRARGVPSKDAALVTEESARPTTFEYFAHAVSIIPIEMWPLFQFRRRAIIAHGWRGPPVDVRVCKQVREFVNRVGSATVSDFGGTTGGGWEGRSAVRVAADWLVATGALVCLSRHRWRRVYYPVEILDHELIDQKLTDAECLSSLIARALRSLGVATAADVADYFRLDVRTVRGVLRGLEGLRELSIEGWPETAWVFEAELDSMRSPPAVKEICLPLSPFDSLIWTRARMRRLFGIEYLLEAYKPPAQRSCGYFGMPVLTARGIAGRVAVRRRGGAFSVEGMELAPGGTSVEIMQAVAVLRRWYDEKH